MKDPNLWNVLRRSWRTMMAPRDAGRAAPPQTASTETALLALALRALESEDLPSIMQSACAELRIRSGADCTSLIMIDPDRQDGSCHIVAADGWRTDVVGTHLTLPRQGGGPIAPQATEQELDLRTLSDIPFYAQQGLSSGFGQPILQNQRTAGWITAHARAASSLDRTSWPVAATLAGIIGAALTRELDGKRIRKDAAHARALCQTLPVLWLCIDGRSGTLLDCNDAIGSLLGRTAADCIGKPAALLFESQGSDAIGDVLCRPATTGAEIGMPVRLLHRKGDLVACVADGVLLGESGEHATEVPQVLWVLHEQQTFQWAAQRRPTGGLGDAPHDFDWTLECHRARRQDSLRCVNSLRRTLQELRRLTTTHPGDADGSGQSAHPATDRVSLLLDQAWQAAEEAAIAFGSPDESLTDLLSALQRLAEDVSRNAPGLCTLECTGQLPRLSDKRKLAAFRTVRELLAELIEERNCSRIIVRVDTTTPNIVRFCLVGEAPAKDPVPIRTAQPAVQRGSLGLFGIKTMLAGVGGVLTIAPGHHRTPFAEFQIPGGHTTTAGMNIRSNLG
jgi:PAS domain-containing protein